MSERDDDDHKGRARSVGICPECNTEVYADEVRNGKHRGGRCKGCPITPWADEEKGAAVDAAEKSVRDAAERLIEAAKKHVTMGNTHPHTPLGLYRELHAITTAVEDMQQGLLDTYRAEWNRLDGGRRTDPPRDHFIVDLDKTRVSDGAVFWREDGGYTMDMYDAGRFTLEDCRKRICRDQDVAIPCDALNSEYICRVMRKAGLDAAEARQLTYNDLKRNRRP